VRGVSRLGGRNEGGKTTLFLALVAYPAL